MELDMAQKNTKNLRCIGIIFFISFIARTVLGSYYPRTVNCYPDEMLYLGAAESLWNHGNIQVFNLPSQFGKVAYAALIAPAFATSDLKLRTFLIAAICALVMSLGVFPIYALAKNILKEDRFVRWSVAFYALSSTMTYSMTYTSETLFVPAMVWLLYLIYLLLAGKVSGKKKAGTFVLAILVWFLAYMTKELALVIPVALVGYFLTVGVVGALKNVRSGHASEKKTKPLLIILALLLMAAACIGIYLFSNSGTAYYQLGFDFDFLRERGWYLAYSILFFVVTTLIGFLFIPVLYPIIFNKKLQQKARRFLLFLCYVILVTAAVAAYTIYIYEEYPSLTPRAHIRYVEYLFVPFLILLFAVMEAREQTSSLAASFVDKSGENESPQDTGMEVLDSLQQTQATVSQQNDNAATELNQQATASQQSNNVATELNQHSQAAASQPNDKLVIDSLQKPTPLHLAILAIALLVCLIAFNGFSGQTIDHTMLFFLQAFAQGGQTFSPLVAKGLILAMILVVAILTHLFYNKTKLFTNLLLAGILIVTLGNNILSTYVQYKTHTHGAAETAEAELVRDFVRSDEDIRVGVIEVQDGHDELLDTFLVDCDNVRTINVLGGWYGAYSGGDMVEYGLLAVGDITKGVHYMPPQTLDYVLVDTDGYVIEASDEGSATVVATYPNLGYTLYKLTDSTHLPAFVKAE